MSEQENSESKSYRKLLIFVLAFQAILATGWIVYDNYANYLENPNQIALSSLLASATGLVIVFLVWILLNSSEKEREKEVRQAQENELLNKKQHGAVKVPEGSAQDLANIDAYLSDVEGTVLWEYNSTEKVFLDLNKDFSKNIEYPTSATLLSNLQNTDAIGLRPEDKEVLEEAFPYEQKNILVLAIKQQGIVIGMLTLAKPQESTWQDEELQNAKALLPKYEAELLAHLSQKKIAELERREFLLTEATENEQFATAIFKLNSPIDQDTISLAEMEESTIWQSNGTFDDYFSKIEFSELLTDTQLEALRNNGQTIFDNRNEDKLLTISLKVLHESAKVIAFVLSAVKAKETTNEKGIHYQLIEKSEDLFLTVNRENNICFVSKSAESFFGLSSSAANASNILSFVPEGSYEQLEQAIEQAKRSNKRHYINALPFRNHSNEIVAYDCIFYPLAENEGHGEIAIELRLIEERLEMAASMQKKHQLLADLLNLTDEVVTVVDEEGKIQFVSDNMQKHFGYTKESRIDKYVFDFVAPEYTAKVHENFDRVKHYPSFQSRGEISYLHKNGNWEKVILKQVNMLENELVNGIVIKFTKKSDFTVDKKPEFDQDLLARIFEKQETPILLLDNNGGLSFSNSSIQQFLGYSTHDLHQRSFIDFVHPKEQDAIKNNLDYLESTPEDTLQTTIHLKNKNGAWQKVEINTSAIAKDNNTLAYLVQFQHSLKKTTEKETDIAFRARFYNALLSGTSNILAFSDFEANIKYVNAIGKERLGYQLKGNLRERIHSNAHLALENTLQKIKDKKSAFKQLEGKIIDKEGKWLSCQISVRNALNFSSFKGAVIEIVILGQATEKNEHVLGEAALTWLNNLENTGIAFLLKNGDILYKNSTLEEVLQKPVQNSLDIQNAIKEQSELQKIYKKFINSPEVEQSDFFYNHFGQRLYVTFNSINGNSSDAHPIFILSVKKESKEVSAEKTTIAQYEEKVQEQEAQLKHATEQISKEPQGAEQESSQKIEESHQTSKESKSTVVVPELLNNFEGEPELINANDILENIIANYKATLAADLSVVKEFKNDTWIVCKKQFLEKVFDTVFEILQSGSENGSGKIMITAQKEDKIVSVAISENFSENLLKKATEGFISGEVQEGPVKELYELGKVLESYNGKIKIHSEADQGISINMYLPDKIGMNF